MDEKEAAPPPSNALQSQRIYDYSEPQLQNHKNPNFDQTLKFDQGYNNNKTKIDRKNNHPDRKTPDSINTDRVNTERKGSNITDRINTDCRINADRVFTNRRNPTGFQNPTTITTEINHTDRLLHNAKFLNTNSINKTDRINSDNNAADQTVTLLGSSDLLGGTQMHQTSTRSTSSSASSASPQQLDQETYNNMETESVEHFGQMKKMTELENQKNLLETRNFTHKSHNLTPTKDSDHQTTTETGNFQDSQRFEYENSETVFTEVNNLQETHLVENYCESNGELEPEDGLYEDYEYEIEYDARYRVNSASRQTDTADLNNPESVAVDEQFGEDEIMLGYEGEQIEMEEDYENNSLKTPSKDNLSKSSRSTSVSSSTQASPMNLLQSHSPNLYNKSPSIKKSLNNQSKSSSAPKSASQNSLQNSTSTTISHSTQQSNQSSSSSAAANNNNSTQQTTTTQLYSSNSTNTHHHFSIANTRKQSHPNISRMRTTPPPRKSHRKTSSNEIHRTPSLDALTGNFLKSRGIGAGWPKDFESIVVCTRSTQTPEDWAVVEAEFNEEILMEIQNEIQQHMKNSNSNSMVKSSNIVPNFVTKIQENRLKPEDIALKPLTSRIPIKLEMRRIAKNRQEQKRASSPIHVNHNAAIPVGSRPLKSSPYGVTGTTTGNNSKYNSSDRDNMSSEGTSHGRNSQSPTPNTSNSNSVNSTPTKIITSNNPAINTQHQPIIIPNTRRVIGSQEALNQEVEAVFSRKEPFHSKTPPDGRRCPVPLCAAYCSPVLKPSSSPNGYAYNSGAAAATVNAQYFLYSDFGGRSPKRTTPVSSGSHSRQSSNTSVASTQTKEVAALMGSLNICENGSPRPASPMNNNNNNCSPRYARNTSPVLFIKDREHIRRMVVREPPEGAEDRKNNNNNNASSSRSSSRNGKQQLLHPMHQPKPSYEPLNRYLNQSNVAASLQPANSGSSHLIPISNLPSNLLANHNNPSNLPKNCSSVTPTPQNTQQTCNCNTSPSQNQHVVATQHLQHCPLLNVPQTSSSRTNKHRTMSTTSSGYSTAAASSVASYSSFSSNYTGKTSSSGSSLFYPPPHQPGIKQKILPSRPDRRGGKNFNPCQANFKPRPQSTRYNNKPMTPVAGQGAACDANGFAINTLTPSQTPTIEQNSGNGYQSNGYPSNSGYQNNGFQNGYQNSQANSNTGSSSSYQNSQQGFYPVTSDYHSAYQLQSINVTPAHYANYANNNYETNNTSLLRNSSSSTPQQEHSPPQPTES